MGCFRCFAVAIPESDPPICPECFVASFPRRSSQCEVGIQEMELTLTEMMERWPGLFKDVIDVTDLASRFSFHVTDFDDPVLVSRYNGSPRVWAEWAGGTRQWVSWDEYVQTL